MERGRQILRQWKVLRLLEQSRRGMTVAELCDVLQGDATRRTVYRDLEQLQEVGFPLENENGHWAIATSHRQTWSVPVDPSHVLALQVVGELLGPIRGTWLSEPIYELEERLRVLLTAAGRGYCEELRQQVAATLFKPVALPPEVADVAARIDEALNKEQRLQIVYQSLGKPPEARVVEPYATWFADGRLYLVAFCRRAQAFRTFAVQRIQAIEVLDEVFERASSFDLEAFTHAGFGVFHDTPQVVVLEFLPEVAYVPRERVLHATQTLTDLPDGRLRLEMTVGGLPELAAWVVSFGGAVRAVAPAALLAEVRRRFEAGLAAHEDL